MFLQTERLILRPWRESDAGDLFAWAKDRRVGPAAGWPAHESVEESLGIIRTVFSHPGVFAVTRRDDPTAVGCVGLIVGVESNLAKGDDEGEISYWIGVPFWGRGFIPEAVRELVRYGFEDLGLSTLWCGYFDGNEQSKRVQEKCGFRYHHTDRNRYDPSCGGLRTEHATRLTRAEWAQRP